VRTGTSILRGLEGRGVVSTRGVSIGGLTGLGGAQLLVPPACTVLHQGQRIGSTLNGGAGGCAVIGSIGDGLAAGSVCFSGTTVVLGVTTEAVD
jgi:hypothetical protein